MDRIQPKLHYSSSFALGKAKEGNEMSYPVQESLSNIMVCTGSKSF